MKLKNTFVQSKMNVDLDERLLPTSEYPYALNVRVSNSETGDAGAAVNSKGNLKLTALGISGAVTIGSYADTSSQKLYWFLTSPTKDMVLEYNNVTNTTAILLQSTKPNGVLNFDKNFLITGINKVINGDHTKDLLIWTDNLNPPRKINIERAKTYALDGFTKDDINLIKRPPIYAPTVAPTFDTTTDENSIEDRFLSFSYRYKFLDGEYSALSSFTYYKFIPSDFNLDFQEMINKGMVNVYNAVNISFNTGDHTVTDVQLVVKESNSNAVAIIDTFNKVENSWADNTTQTLKFSNNKKYIYLPEEELFRSYDNVPRTAKAQELVNNRLLYGNYEEGFDLKDSSGNNIVFDYDVTVDHQNVIPQTLPTTVTSTFPSYMTINLAGIPLKANSSLTFNFKIHETSATNGYSDRSYKYILSKDYTDANALANDVDFIQFVQIVMTNQFEESYVATPLANTVETTVSGFTISGHTSTTLSIQPPTITYKVDNTPANMFDNDFTNHVLPWFFDSSSTVVYRNIGVTTSLKTNRSYEVGLVYLDDYNRASTVITCKDNAVRVPQKYSVGQSKFIVDINNPPPADAVRYKLAIKQNKAEYQTIYANLFYEDTLYRWIKLEGANVNKVSAGDNLIVKSDLSGPLNDVVKVKVLEVTTQPADFIVGNKDSLNNLIIEEAGLYMKIKPEGINMTGTPTLIGTFVGFNHLRYPARTFTTTEFGTRDASNVFVPYPIKAGYTIHIYIKMGRDDGSLNAVYDKTFRASANYASVKAWFDAEVIDLGQFGVNYTWDGFTPLGPNICAGGGIGNSMHRFSGWGFGISCENSTTVSAEPPNRFFVVPHDQGSFTVETTAEVRFEILATDGIVIFETEPQDTTNDVYYETEETFDIVNGYHLGNIQNQGVSQSTAIVEVDFFNCYSQGNGAESYRYQDDFNSRFLNIDLRPTSTSVEKFKKVRRYADLTYSGVYNENNNLNELNVFNLATLNYKEDIDKRYGFIQKIYAHQTDLITFQEDKVSKVLFGKDLLYNADGTTNLSAIQDILGRQITYTGEYGISRNPESFAFFGNSIYFTDAKRGVVCRLANDGIIEISQAGMQNFFKDQYKNNINDFKFGGYDPYYGQYVLSHNAQQVTLTFDEEAKGWTSFFSYVPDYMIGMNNQFFSFKGGELYLHNSDTADRCNFYGVQYPTKISLMVNDSPSDVKELQAVSLEGNYPWDIVITAFRTSDTDNSYTHLYNTDFVLKEGFWYSYARRDENTARFDSKAVYGIGQVTAVNTGVKQIIVNGYSSSLTTGDSIFRGSNQTLIGTVVSSSRSGNSTVITLNSIAGTVAVNEFVYGTKGNRVEGGSLRGYNLRMDLTNSVDTGKVELFAVNSEIIKSFP